MNRTFPILVLFAPLLLGASAPAPEADYAERAAKLEGKKDAKAWLKLADFAEEHLLWEKREEALRKALEQDPENAEAHERLDERKWNGEWLPAEEAEAKEAEEKQAKGLVLYGKGWVKAKEADKLREADRKEVGWPMELRLDTPHLRIYSAKPLPFTRRLAAILESEIGVYEKLYGKVLKLDPKPLILRVYVFEDRDTLDRICERNRELIVLSPGVLAWYSSSKTQILCVMGDLAGPPERSVLQMAATEMNQAIDDLLAHVLVSLGEGGAMWLIKGRAYHLGYSVHGRRILPGVTTLSADDGTLQVLAEAIDGVALRNLMGLDQKAFEANGMQNARIAWAWVHFLFHGEGGKHAPGFRTYLQGIPGKAATTHFEMAVGPLSDLEPAFKRYVKETLIPMMEKAQAKP